MPERGSAMFNMAGIARSSTALLPALCILFDASGARWAQAQVATVSPSVAGGVDKIKRGDDGRLLITGWGPDIHGNGVSVWVVSIYDGQVVFTGSTFGVRGDVAKAYPQAIADNVVISGTSIPVDCRANQKVITLAITTRHQFAIIGRSDIEGCP
jgi:hypothetical protein